MSYAELDERLENDPNIVVCWKWCDIDWKISTSNRADNNRDASAKDAFNEKNNTGNRSSIFLLLCLIF